MALDFPDSPAIGDLYGSTGTVWRWDGTMWLSTSGISGTRGAVAYAQIVAPIGGYVATLTDVYGLNVTFQADPSRTYRTTFQGMASSTVASDDLQVQITDGAGVPLQMYLDPGLDSQTSSGISFSLVERGLSGPVTRKIMAARSAGSGTVTMYAQPNVPSFILVEDITFEAGSSGTPVAMSSGSSTIEVGTKVGVISSFSGDVIPADSLICDGQVVPAGAEYDALRAIVGTNVPDLRDKFLLGASATKALRSVGGAETHTLTEAEGPVHTHTIHDPGHSHQQVAGWGTGADAYAPWDGVGHAPYGMANTSGAGTGISIYNSAGGAPHNNMPPWYAVVYIIQAKPTMATVAGGSGGGGGSGFTFVQDTKPVATKQGDTWLSTASTAAGGTSYVAIDNGTGALNWVQFAPGTGTTVPPAGVVPLFQSIAERNAYYVTNPPIGTRCYVRLCEWMWNGAWVGIPFTQAATMVATADATGIVSWTYGIPFASWLGGLAVASSHPNDPNCSMADPAGYDPTTSLRFITPALANSTWRWEVAAWGFLDGYT